MCIGIHMKVQKGIKEIKTIRLSELIMGEFFEFEGNLHILLRDDCIKCDCLRLNDNTNVNINCDQYIIPIDEDYISITYRID